MSRVRKWAPASGVVAAGVIAALTLAGCSSVRSATATPSSSSSALTTPSAVGTQGTVLQQVFVNVVNKVRPSVVEISTSSGLGSGVVFDAQGDIVTNDHVVGSASNFR
jgi:putative serine protease PepD